jgi:phosphatidylserine/phosphatidylglycerophosphate/cardiolipin synthase-like enzyme
MTDQTNNLYNETNFYRAFIKDALSAEKEVIIYSPFISQYRASFFKVTLSKLKRRNINVFIFTRPIEEHEEYIQDGIKAALESYKRLGAHIVYLDGTIHEKVAIIDRKILWEGSLNILSQKASKELMTRTADEEFATQIMSNLALNQKLINGYKSRGLHHNLRLDFRQRINIFLIEPAIFAIKWSLTIIFQVMAVLLKGILAVFNIIDVILG